MISVLTSVSRGSQRLLAGEREQMLGEIGAARRGLVDHPRDGGKLRLVLDRVGQDFDRSGDDGQDIVEVVRDAAGELADRFHLLGLPDPVLGRDLVGEVADESVEHEARRGVFSAVMLSSTLISLPSRRTDLESRGGG